MNSFSTAPLDVAILESTADFAALENDWDELYQSAPLATPFQSWAWLYSWWEHYADSGHLRLVTLRDGGLLVGIIPLVLQSKFGIGRLLFLGTGITDYLDIIVRERWERRIAESCKQALERIGSWQVADLQELRPEATAWRLFEDWDGAKARLPQTGCPMVEVKSWDELLARLSKNHRSTVRRTLRRAEEDGLSWRMAGANEAERATRRWVALHRETWQERGIEPEHLTPRFESCMVAAITRMTAGGLGGISVFGSGEEVVASHLLVLGRDFVGEHLFGANGEALKRYQINALFVRDMVQVALARDLSRVSFLRGPEPYKLRWSTGIAPNHRVVLGRSLAPVSLYLGYRDLRSKYSESTPEEIKRLVTKLRRR